MVERRGVGASRKKQDSSWNHMKRHVQDRCSVVVLGFFFLVTFCHHKESTKNPDRSARWQGGGWRRGTKFNEKDWQSRTAEVISQDVEHIPTDGCGGFGSHQWQRYP